MWNWPARIFVVAFLVLALLAGLTASASATNHDGPTEIFFPWVPTGATLGESGPYYGTVTVQNLESAEIRIFPTPTSTLDDPDPPLLQSFTLGPHASVTLTPSQMNFEPGTQGSGVIVTGEFVESAEPARIAGMQKQSSDQPPSNDARTGSEHTTTDGYAALGGNDIGTDIVLPIVQTNTGWNTLIRVTNLDDSDTANTIRVALHEAGGGTAPVVFTEVLGSGQTETFDLLDRGISPGWVGSAVITADSDIGAVAERVKPATNMLLINQSSPANQSGRHAPLLLQDWNNWNTGISLVNLSDAQQEMTIEYHGMDGSLIDSDDLTLPPRGMDFVFTPASPENEGFVGSAFITGSGPVTAAVDEVKYLGDDQDTGHAMSYTTVNRPGNDDYLLVPLVQKGDPGTGLGDTTGIQIVEAIGWDATVKIWFLDQLGNIVSPEPEVVELGPREGHTAYTMFLDYLPSGFQGSALIRTMEGEVVAASNNVNYEVQYDGSASMNMTVAAHLYAVAELELSASPNPVPYFSRTATLSARVVDRFGDPFPSGAGIVISEESSQAYLTQPGSTVKLQSGPFSTDDNGTSTAEIHIAEDALSDRPVEVIVSAEIGGGLDQTAVTWQPQPQVQQ